MAVRILELGDTTPVYIPPPSLLKPLYRFVNTFEDPLAAAGGYKADKRVKEIARKLRRASMEARFGLVPGLARRKGIGDIFGFFSDVFETGSSIVGKIGDVLGDESFLSIASLASNFIGGDAGEMLSGLIGRISGKDPEAATTAAATAQSIGQASPENAGNSSLLSSLLPPELQSIVAGLVGDAVPGIKDREDDVIAAALKALGQFTAIQTMSQGAGAGAIGGSAYGQLANLIMVGASGNVRDAINAGQEDLLNAAALSGNLDAVREALRRGTPNTFPWTEVAIGGGVTVVVVTGLIIASRRS